MVDAKEERVADSDDSRVAALLDVEEIWCLPNVPAEFDSIRARDAAVTLREDAILFGS